MTPNTSHSSAVVFVVVFPKDLEFLVSQARNVSPSGQLEVSVRGGGGGWRALKEQRHEIFDFRFYHESVSSKPLSNEYTVKAFSNFFRKFSIFVAQGAPPVSFWTDICAHVGWAIPGRNTTATLSRTGGIYSHQRHDARG
jgi:hypothetical protein